MKKRPYITIVAIALVVAAGYLALRPRPIVVETTEVSRRDVLEYIAEDAKTRLEHEYIVDMPISGTVERLRLEEGDAVQEGECLVNIDAFDLQKQVDGMQALIAQTRAQMSGVDTQKPKTEDLAAAEVSVRESAVSEAMAAREFEGAKANYDAAQKEYQRVKALREQGAVSQAQFDEVKRQHDALAATLDRVRLAQDSARKAREISELSSKSLQASVDDPEYLRDVYRAELDSRQAQLDSLERELTKAEVKSPIAGVVIETYIEDKRALVAGTPLLKLGDTNSIEIECDVLSEEIGRVKPDDPVEISGKALLGKTVMGKVKRIYPAGFKKISALGIEQQRVQTIIEFDNAGVRLRPGTSVDVKIVVAENKNVLAVPERATFRSGDGWAVFTVKGGKAVLTTVTIGLKNDEWAEITSGLADGDVIVAEPKNELQDGARVSAE